MLAPDPHDLSIPWTGFFLSLDEERRQKALAEGKAPPDPICTPDTYAEEVIGGSVVTLQRDEGVLGDPPFSCDTLDF